MEYFHNFCEQHKLKYFMIGGTLLGAIRHQGFIPWDDDLDVGMLRPDYNKLISLTSKITPPYKLRDISLETDYIYPFAKLTNEAYIVTEQFQTPFQTGIWIDIFPFDATFNTKIIRALHFQITSFIRKLFIIKYESFNIKKYSIFTLILLNSLHPICRLIPRAFFLKAFKYLENIQKHHLDLSTIYLANLYGAWGAKECAPSILFSKLELYAFEDLSFYSIEDYDFWLTKVYGDYTKIPDVTERKSHNFD